MPSQATVHAQDARNSSQPTVDGQCAALLSSASTHPSQSSQSGRARRQNLPAPPAQRMRAAVCEAVRLCGAHLHTAPHIRSRGCAAHLAPQGGVPVVLDVVVGAPPQVLGHERPLRRRRAVWRCVCAQLRSLMRTARPGARGQATAKLELEHSQRWPGLAGGVRWGSTLRPGPTWLPYLRWKRTITTSSSRAHSPRLMSGLRWLCHLQWRGEGGAGSRAACMQRWLDSHSRRRVRGPCRSRAPQARRTGAPLAALLADAPRQVLGDERPLLGAVQTHKPHDGLVLFPRPGALVQVGVEDLWGRQCGGRVGTCAERDPRRAQPPQACATTGPAERGRRRQREAGAARLLPAVQALHVAAVLKVLGCTGGGGGGVQACRQLAAHGTLQVHPHGLPPAAGLSTPAAMAPDLPGSNAPAGAPQAPGAEREGAAPAAPTGPAPHWAAAPAADSRLSRRGQVLSPILFQLRAPFSPTARLSISSCGGEGAGGRRSPGCRARPGRGPHAAAVMMAGRWHAQLAPASRPAPTRGPTSSLLQPPRVLLRIVGCSCLRARGAREAGSALRCRGPPPGPRSPRNPPSNSIRGLTPAPAAVPRAHPSCRCGAARRGLRCPR